jgi:hypothetical protein
VESIIIWDDMLRNFMSSEMMPLKDLVVPMVWVYAEEVYHFMPTYNWDRFSEVFPTAWTASAYKGIYSIQPFQNLVCVRCNFGQSYKFSNKNPLLGPHSKFCKK